MSDSTFPVAYLVESDERIGQGGFLQLRRLRLRMRRRDGSASSLGTYDYVERPRGPDAVVVAIWSRVGGRIQTLLRAGLRVPVDFSSDTQPVRPSPFVEAVAGIIEKGEEAEASIRVRAAAEVWEEAGLRVDATQAVALGPWMYATPGLCPERFYFFAFEVSADSHEQSVTPPTDGSPFEEGAILEWLELSTALDHCRAGEIRDVKTELILRRLTDYLADK